MDSILEDKELMRTQLDLQKRFPIYHVVSQMLGGPSLRHGDTKGGLNNPSGLGCGGKDTGRLVTWEFPLRTDSASWKFQGIGFLSGSKNFSKLLCVSCEVFVLHGYDWIH